MSRQLFSSEVSEYCSSMVTGFGKRVQEFRTSLGFSQGELALSIGVSRQTVANVESGQYGFSLDVLARLRGLGADLNWLVGDQVDT